MDTSAHTVKLIAEIVTAAASLIAGWWALLTYRQSVNLERAKWVKELYEKFYERNDLKDVRDLLDSDDQNKIAELVQTEPRNFTDYLNFFEFLAYLSRSKQIGKEEVSILFDYYLENLSGNKNVRDYISNSKKSFEQLRELLGLPGQGDSK
ncbi:MAG: hypothetical protein KGM47_00245 [Acidobacteriota bacterium]|nr:hypothetical protein [Acidobacteriota bacterium]